MGTIGHSIIRRIRTITLMFVLAFATYLAIVSQVAYAEDGFKLSMHSGNHELIVANVGHEQDDNDDFDIEESLEREKDTGDDIPVMGKTGDPSGSPSV